jgi:hypothetical protein
MGRCGSREEEFVERESWVDPLPPVFFVSVASKGVRFGVTALESTLAEGYVSIDFKRVSGAFTRRSSESV